MTTLTPRADSFTGGPNASKPAVVHNPNYEAYQASPQKNVNLSYPHKIDWPRLTNVRCGSIMGETWVHWQFGYSPSTDSGIRSVSSSTTEYICLPTCLSAYLWVCLFVYQTGILPVASDLYKLRHCLGLKHNFFRDVHESKQSKSVYTKKICGGDFGPPW